PALARDTPPTTAEIRDTKRHRVEAVQLRQPRIDRIVDGGPHGRSRTRNIRLPENTTPDEVHEVERRADHARITAIVERPRDRKALRGKLCDHPEFAIDRVC